MALEILLAPGASGSVAGLAPFLDGLRQHGLEAHGVELPRGRAERALPVFARALEGHDPRSTLIGGHSFGGRVASLLAPSTEVAGLLLLSYPLHAPGRHAGWDERTAHWPQIRWPVLLLSGEADPFARLDLLRTAVERLPDHDLVTYPRMGHRLLPVLDDVLRQIAAFATRSR